MRPLLLCTASWFVIQASRAVLMPPSQDGVQVPLVGTETPSTPAEDPDFRQLWLPCPACVVQLRKPASEGSPEASVLTHPMPSHLEVNIAVEHASHPEADRLLVNGFEVFPRSEVFLQSTPHARPSALILPGLAKVSLMSGNTDEVDISQYEPHQVPLGHLLCRLDGTFKQDGGQRILVSIGFVETAYLHIDGVDWIDIELHRPSNGGLSIVEISTSEMLDHTPNHRDPRCISDMCMCKFHVHKNFECLRGQKYCFRRHRWPETYPTVYYQSHVHGNSLNTYSESAFKICPYESPNIGVMPRPSLVERMIENPTRTALTAVAAAIILLDILLTCIRLFVSARQCEHRPETGAVATEPSSALDEKTDLLAEEENEEKGEAAIGTDGHEDEHETEETV